MGAHADLELTFTLLRSLQKHAARRVFMKTTHEITGCVKIYSLLTYRPAIT